VVAPGEPGYLDTVLAGTGCKDLRASRSARLYAFGATLQEIGDLFGVTRERIRQILSRDTPWSSTDLSAAAKALAAARRTEHTAAADEWSRTHPAAPLDAARAALGLSEEQVRRLLGRRRSRHEPAFEVPRETARRTEEEIVADLRAFHTETGKTTCQAFTAWAREHDVPGHQTAAIRFGTWNEALKAAGLGEEKGAPRSSFRDEDLWAAVLSAVQAEDGGTTFRAVSDWLAQRPAAPSGVLIRKRLCGQEGGSWTETVTTALAVLNAPADFHPACTPAAPAPPGGRRAPRRATGTPRPGSPVRSTTCAPPSTRSARGSPPPGTAPGRAQRAVPPSPRCSAAAGSSGPSCWPRQAATPIPRR